jgi:hypothetical protein
MVGGRLPSADDWTLSLLTNPEVLEVDQHSTGNHPVVRTEKVVAWRAESPNGHYLAVFNISESPESLHYDWKDLGLGPASYQLRDLWKHQELGRANALRLDLPSHASVLYSAIPDTMGGR